VKEEGRTINEEDISDFITQYNMLDYMATYMSVYHSVGSHLMADLLQSIQYRFDKQYRRCHYEI
jgi:hypothetical protein